MPEQPLMVVVAFDRGVYRFHKGRIAEAAVFMNGRAQRCHKRIPTVLTPGCVEDRGAKLSLAVLKRKEGGEGCIGGPA